LNPTSAIAVATALIVQLLRAIDFMPPGHSAGMKVPDPLPLIANRAE